MPKISDLARFFMLPILLVLWNAILTMTGTYDKFSWLGMPMHFVGGIFIAYAFLLTFDSLKKEKYFKLNTAFTVVFVISLVSLFAVLWEFYEFGVDYFFHLNYQPSLPDTMFDLFLGLFGGLISSAFFILRKN